MVKSQIIAVFSQVSGLSLQDAAVCVNELLETISDALSESRDVQVRGFGTFVLNKISHHMARNPKTGEPVVNLSSSKPHFKPGKLLRRIVNEHYGEPIHDA